jgi:hypothetical protein
VIRSDPAASAHALHADVHADPPLIGTCSQDALRAPPDFSSSATASFPFCYFFIM